MSSSICRLTDQLVRTALHAGASILSIHGRTRHQSSDSHPVDLDAIRFAVDSANACGNQSACASSTTYRSASQSFSSPNSQLTFDGGGAGGSVPCVANGDVWSLDEADTWRSHTGASGIMSARGLLSNPALFTQRNSHLCTPSSAMREFAALSPAWSLPFALFHRHIAYMLEGIATRGGLWRQEAIYFNSLASIASVMDWLEEYDYIDRTNHPLLFSSTNVAKRQTPA